MSADVKIESLRDSADLSTILPRLRNTLLRKGATGRLWDRCDEHTRLLWCALAHVDSDGAPPFAWSELPESPRMKLLNCPGVMLSLLRRLAELPRG
jgi:hypothetical protein